MAYRRTDEYYKKKLNELREYEKSLGEEYNTYKNMGLTEFKKFYDEGIKFTNATDLMKDAKWSLNHDVSRKTFRELSKFLHGQEKEQRENAEWGQKKNVKHYSKEDIKNVTTGGTRDFIKAHRSELKKLWKASEMADRLNEGEFYSYYIFGSK
jgi:hypothetical protein